VSVKLWAAGNKAPVLYDVAVVGAGPAGCAAALRTLQVRPRAGVVLLDASAFPRDKVCGDGIAPHVLDAYASLGVAGLGDGWPEVPRLQVRSPGGVSVDRVMARPARVIPRYVFDARLVAAATAAGAELRRYRVRRVDVRADRVVLNGEVEARVVIGADGATGVVRRQLGLAAPAPAAVGVAIRAYARTAPTDPQGLLIAVSARHCPGYAWIFPLPEGANVGFGVFGQPVPGGRRELIERLISELPGVEFDPASVRGHQLPLSTKRLRQPDGRVLFAGDAAGLVNPITGEGILYAALSGAAAGEAGEHGVGAGQVHRAALRRLFAAHHRHTAVLARCARSRRFVDATIAATARHQHVFDTVVELGLGRGTADPLTLSTVLAGYAADSRRAMGLGRDLCRDRRLSP
jgi:menaquinone-9 beta-reductase